MKAYVYDFIWVCIKTNKLNLQNTYYKLHKMSEHRFSLTLFSLIRTESMEPFSVDWLWTQTLKTLRVYTNYHDKMENRHAYTLIFFFFLVYIFSFEMIFSLESIINIFLPTHPSKTSDWHFDWQNGYGYCPIINEIHSCQFWFY